MGTVATPFESNVMVTNNAFSTTHTLISSDSEQTCTLRAIPHGSTPTDLTPFAGPRLGIGRFSSDDFTGGAAAGDPYDFDIYGNLLSGQADFRSLAGGGMFEAYPIDPATQHVGGDLFFDNDSFRVFPGQTRSSIQVDGVNAFGSAGAEQVCGSSACSLPGIPALTISHTLSATNGNLVIHESEPLVKCSPDPAVYPPTGTSCTSFVPTGVSASRMIELYANGRQASLDHALVEHRRATAHPRSDLIRGCLQGDRRL